MGDDPEEFVEAAQHRSQMATLQHNELLPQSEVLQDKTVMAVKDPSERSDPEKKQTKHGPELYQNRCWTPQ
jgi:hypothetical protein